MPLPPSTIKFSDIQTQYKKLISTNVKLGEFSRNANYVPSFNGNDNIPEVSGSVIRASNIKMSNFNNAVDNPFIIRDQLTDTTPSNVSFYPPSVLYKTTPISGEADFPVVFHQLSSPTEGTLHVAKSTDGAASIVTFSSGSITYFLPTNNSLGEQTANQLVNPIHSAAYNSTLGIAVMTTRSRSIFDLSGYQVVWTSGSFNSAWNVVPSDQDLPLNGVGTPWSVYAWGSYFIASRGFTNLSAEGVPIGYSSNGSTWTVYYLNLSVPNSTTFSASLTITGNRVFLHGTNGTVYTTTNPIDSNSWVKLNSIYNCFGSNFVSTICINNGICIAGSNGGKIAYSANLIADDFILIDGSTGLTSNYWFSNLNAGTNFVASIYPYKNGFIAFGTYNGANAWSIDGVNWYFGIGTNSLVGNNASGNLIHSNSRQNVRSWYYPALDRLYNFYTDNFSGGFFYSRTNGNDLQYISNQLDYMQTQKLLGSDTSNSDWFRQVSMSGDGLTAAVGAWGNGASGAVYIFTRPTLTSQWTQIQKISSGYTAGARFGESVSLSKQGLYLAVGAIYDSQGGTNRGIVGIYRRSNNTSTFTFNQTLQNSTGALNTWYGYQVFLNEYATELLVAAPLESFQSTPAAGIVYSYTRTGSSTLFSGGVFNNLEGSISNAYFGEGLSSYNSIHIIGAPSANRAYAFSVGILIYTFIPPDSPAQFGAAVSNSIQHVAIGSRGSGVYIYFRLNDGSYLFQTKITQPVDDFGRSVEITNNGDTLVIGSNNGAYVYNRLDGVGSKWYLYSKLYGSDTASTDSFGSRVATDYNGTSVLVGSLQSNTTFAGAAYSFDQTTYKTL